MSDIIRRRALLGGTRNTDAHECIVEYEFPRSHHNDRFPNSFGTKNITEVNWPEGITGIESYTFRGSSIDCNNFNEIPSTVTQIGKYAFANCLNLQGSITLPENLETLGDYSFYYCSGITTVTLPTTDCVFGYYSVYLAKNFNATNGVMYVFTYGALSSNSGTWLNTQPSGNVYLGNNYVQYKGTMPYNTNLTIEPGTLSIAASAFNGKTQLKSITIPDTVKYIGAFAFSGCTGLTSITIPKSLDNELYENLNSNADYVETWPSGTATTNITLERYVNSTYTYVSPFYNTACTGITTVNWNAVNGYGGSSATNYYCFLGGGTYLPNLTTINFGSEVESIPNYLCYGLKKLTTITIPSSVKYIGQQAFSGCTGLTSFTIPETVEKIHTSGAVLSGCTGITVLNYNAVSCVRSSSMSATGVTTLNSIWGATSNLTTVNIGNQVQVIPGGLLGTGQSKVTSITIPNSVTTISYAAFYQSKLTSIDLPASVTRIENYAFASCTSLTSITIRSTTPPTLDSTYSSTFPSTSQNYKIYVPASAVNTYKTTSKWSTWSSRIQAIPS